jgi:hypothetical protein
VGGGRLIKKWQQPPKTTKTFNVRPQPHNHRNTPHTHTQHKNANTSPPPHTQDDDGFT